MNKSFENRSAMSYASKSYKEECWQKIRNGLHGHRGWGKKGEERENNARIGNQISKLVDKLLDEFDSAIETQRNNIHRMHVYNPTRTQYYITTISAWPRTDEQERRFEMLKSEEKELYDLVKQYRGF